MSAKVRTCLWFDGDGEEAARFYVSLLPDSEVESLYRPTADAPPLVVDFRLAGTPYQALNGGPQFPHSEAASISVLTENQAETDRLWAALTADGGSESRCGWLNDRFGVSWQIVPEAVPRLLGADDREAAGRAFQALMGMVKIDIAVLQAAFDGR
jgi:predicted 3-demethylubiquinone-9 3-methyltransferase (glyoxalase superfamily)